MNAALAHLQEEVKAIRAELQHIRGLLEEEPRLAPDLVEEIERSRRHPEELIPHEEIRREFGIK